MKYIETDSFPSSDEIREERKDSQNAHLENQVRNEININSNADARLVCCPTRTR